MEISLKFPEFINNFLGSTVFWIVLPLFTIGAYLLISAIAGKFFFLNHRINPRSKSLRQRTIGWGCGFIAASLLILAIFHPKPAASESPVVSASTNELMFVVIQTTSLRELPDSQSKVIRRLNIGDEVTLLEAAKGYWWKVNYEGTIGWVKNSLLEKG